MESEIMFPFLFANFTLMNKFYITDYTERKRGKGNLDRRLSLATPNILTASNPALVALLTATVATGTPLGICTANK